MFYDMHTFLYLIKFFAEAKVCENYVTAWIQQNVLKLQVPVDDPELQKKRKVTAEQVTHEACTHQ